MFSQGANRTFKCTYCSKEITDIFTDNANRVCCDRCSILSPSKRFKTAESNTFYNALATQRVKNDHEERKSEFNSIINDIETKLNQIKSDLNNGDLTIQEHCVELRRQVQLAKEIKIQELEEISEKMMQKVNEYERDSLKTYSEMNKDPFKSSLHELKLEVSEWNYKGIEFEFANKKKFIDAIHKLNVLKSKVMGELDKLKYSIFANNRMLNYRSFHSSLDSNLLGYLRLDSLDAINNDNLNKIDMTKAMCHFKYEMYKDNLLRHDCFSNERIIDTKILPNKSILFLVDYSATHLSNYNLFLFLIDSNGNFIRRKHLNEIPFIPRLTKNIDLRIYYSNEMICVNYFEYSSDANNKSLINIMDMNFNLIQAIKVLNKKLIGTSKDEIFIMSTNRDEQPPIKIYNWSLECIGRLGQRTNPNRAFYVPCDCKQLIKFKSNEKCYLVLRLANEIRILNETSGEKIKIINQKLVNRIEIDLNNNIILFKKDHLIYYNSDGYFLKVIKLVNFGGNFESNVHYLNDNNFYFFNSISHYITN